LWADTDGVQRNRWILFPVGRAELVSYLNREVPLLDLVTGASFHWVLDDTHKTSTADEGHARRDSYRNLIRIEGLAQISEYLPSKESYFDESLTNDVSMAMDITPESFTVPIDGRWFISDLDKFSKSYSHVYAFLYATRPQFVTNIGERLGRFLRAPWTGGYSRINLFTALEQVIPAVHGLQIRSIEYASPGDITIEALRSVGDDIKLLAIRCAENSVAIRDAVKKVNQALSDNHLRKRNLSTVSDAVVPLDAQRLTLLKDRCLDIAKLLGLEAEIEILREQSPNTIVFSKAVLAIVKQTDRLVDFQSQGLLDLYRAPHDLNDGSEIA